MFGVCNLFFFSRRIKEDRKVNVRKVRQHCPNLCRLEEVRVLFIFLLLLIRNSNEMNMNMGTLHKMQENHIS